MEGVKNRFGFGCMRLPMIEDKVDLEQTKKMVDLYLEEGFNYFDTAHGYIKEQSEKAIRTCLVERHDRDEYILTDKLTQMYFKKQEDIRPFFESQLEILGVDYLDYYLMHAQGATNYEYFKKNKAYETAFELKKEGKIKHVGISFHDRAEVLEQILNDYPEIEVVQIQFNYLDYDDLAIESRKCYEVCVKHNKPVIVMEPVKGGSLVNLPQEAKEVFNKLNPNASLASYAIRFALDFPGIHMVLSGMSSIEQMRDNLSYTKDFVPLNDQERKAIKEVVEIVHSNHLIPCTGCRYCVDGCPKKILIPDIFASFNDHRMYPMWNQWQYYQTHTVNNGKASDCIKCGSCERVCPQHLHIRDLLLDVAKEFEH